MYQYCAYCANQVHAKALLDEKKNHDKRLEDFLQRCLESPFSRKLDLWNFLGSCPFYVFDIFFSDGDVSSI